MASPPLFEARSITKRFGDFTANDEVSLSFSAGSIHALLGENGAGKSTFVKMLYGVLQPDGGDFFWQGERVNIASPRFARGLGIAMVFQHFSLFPALSVAENISLALDDKPSMAALRRRIIDASSRWGLSLDPDCPVGDLSVGEQQRVEILRCLLQNPQLLIMDEPTSVLTPQEATSLFDILRRLAADGCAILYISHKLEEIMALSGSASILRGGKHIGDVIPQDIGTRAMAEMMVGEKVDWLERRTTLPDEDSQPLFSVSGLSIPSPSRFGVSLKDINLSVHHGEILGIAGIAGNGQDELAEALSGERLCPDASVMIFDGDAVGRLGPRLRRRLGIETVPEKRQGHAAVPDMTLVENAFLTHYDRPNKGNTPSGNKSNGLLSRFMRHSGQCKDLAAEIVKSQDVRTPHNNPKAGQLSGGNLQKFIMGRTLSTNPKLAVFSQPTWGVDVGAATAIRRQLLSLAEQGCGIILISQDLEEIFSLSSQIAVLHHGQLSDAHPAGDLTAQSVGLLMGGAAP